MPDEKLPQRTLKTTFWLAALVALVCAMRGLTTVALGLTVGVALGLFSLWSLSFAVPRLFRSESTGAKLVLALLLLCKLPLYGGVLWVATTSPYINPFAIFGGVAFVPGVLFLKVLGYQLVEKSNKVVGDESCRGKSTASN